MQQISRFRSEADTFGEPTRSMRMSGELIGKVDGWTAQQPYDPGRSEAIRRLLQIGLKAKAK
jgi:hypothetical protein